MDWYERNPARIGGARIPVMLPGSKLTMNASPRQTTAFPAFEAAFLQTVAAKLGLSYEQLKGDWTKTNYSSARAALNETWRTITRMRMVFGEQIVEPMHLAWADEAFDKGYLEETPSRARRPPPAPKASKRAARPASRPNAPASRRSSAATRPRAASPAQHLALSTGMSLEGAQGVLAGLAVAAPAAPGRMAAVPRPAIRPTPPL
jgi:hypothetical protein